MPIENSEFEKYKAGLVETIINSKAVKNQLFVVFHNITQLRPEIPIPNAVHGILKSLVEEIVEMAISKGAIKIDLTNPAFKEDIANMACDLSEALNVLTLTSTARLSKTALQLKNELDKLRHPGIEVPDFITKYNIGCLISFATQVAILAINNINSEVLRLTPEETSKEMAETEIIDPTERSPKMVILETVLRLENEQKRRN